MLSLLGAVPQIDGGAVAAIVGIINGALNGIFPILPGLIPGSFLVCLRFRLCPSDRAIRPFRDFGGELGSCTSPGDQSTNPLHGRRKRIRGTSAPRNTPVSERSAGAVAGPIVGSRRVAVRCGLIEAR